MGSLHRISSIRSNGRVGSGASGLKKSERMNDIRVLIMVVINCFILVLPPIC